MRILEGDVRNGRAAYFHIYLDLASDNVRWNEYSADQREEAIRAYEEVETAIRRFPGADTVLVRVGSVEALRHAYPSYFASGESPVLPRPESADGSPRRPPDKA